jgi:DNA repair photolyase
VLVHSKGSFGGERMFYTGRKMEAEPLFELRRRTFDTPQFRGIEFIETEAKSIINHVPGTYLPFNWTINPYRGCSHGCTYCTSGETPILMADGRTKPLADVQVGDRIYGTVRRGNYRRYKTTEVLAHWSTIKPAYRIMLQDGTTLITSGDHRFLSDRGWKHVTGSEWGPDQRPHLTVNNKLMGTGRFADLPKDGPEYRRGYLCGLIRGDGHLGSYSYARPSGLSGRVHRFRLARADSEALERAKSYLLDLGIPTKEFLFRSATAARKGVTAIRAQSRGSVEAIREMIRWSHSPSAAWRKGFLAGIYDAEGSFNNDGTIRISNTDPEIIGHTTESLRKLGFFYVLETQSRDKPLTYVRIMGGLDDKLRFFHTVDPAITRKRSIEGIAIKGEAPLGVVSVEPLGIDIPMYDITTGTGDFIADGVVSHNCFARATHTYMDMDAGRDFETKIVVKVNASQLLRKELRARRWKGEHIAMGTATDPYQRAEGKYKLMRGIVEALTEVRNPFSILTKGTLIMRDLDLLTEAAGVTDVSTAFSIGTLDEDVWRSSEPGTPHPRKRMDAVRRLNEAGIPCGVMLAPVLPGISDSDEQIRAVIEASLDAGATHVSPILLHLRPKVREVYMEWLQENYPDLVERYEAMYPTAYAAPAERKSFGDRVGNLLRAAQLGRPPPAPRFRRSVTDGAERALKERTLLSSEQLKLL